MKQLWHSTVWHDIFDVMLMLEQKKGNTFMVPILGLKIFDVVWDSFLIDWILKILLLQGFMISCFYVLYDFIGVFGVDFATSSLWIEVDKVYRVLPCYGKTVRFLFLIDGIFKGS